MKLNDAKKLHNGDEVIAKDTGESIRVLSTSFHSREKTGGHDEVHIEGLGDKSGYGEWDHLSVR